MNDTAKSDYNFADTLANIEKKHILLVLELSKGNRSLTARRLDVGVRTLQRKLKTYGVKPDDYRGK